MALTVVDRAIQAFGAEGVCQDQELAGTWAGLRTLRIADVSKAWFQLDYYLFMNLSHRARTL